ncbi:Chromate resistance protein ChrB [Cereibacter sediminicola]|uniref:Chromate resistance protein ChrB n=1 Tax=Cereibacter sediminicola TaxID=2584941 RepID=UPI001C92C1C0|nr:Chromate resistance protein ChrB [Cereibacter sediminicola]
MTCNDRYIIVVHNGYRLASPDLQGSCRALSPTHRDLAQAEGHGRGLSAEWRLRPAEGRRSRPAAQDLGERHRKGGGRERDPRNRRARPWAGDKVIARFKAERDEAYAEFIDKCDDFEREVAKEVAASHYSYAELEENDVDLKKLQGWLEKIGKLDFYGAARAEEARARLKGSEAVPDDYAQRVFDVRGENG